MNLVSMCSVVNHGWETILCFWNLGSAFRSRWNCCRLLVVACLLLLLSKTSVCITKIFFHRWWLFPFIFLLKMWWLIQINSDWFKVEDLSPHWPVSFYFADRVDLFHSISFVFFRMRKYYFQWNTINYFIKYSWTILHLSVMGQHLNYFLTDLWR